MIEYRVSISCDRCKNTITIPILLSDILTCVVQPEVVRRVFRKSKWVETSSDQHICPDCRPALKDMNKGIGKLKNKFWRKGSGIC